MRLINMRYLWNVILALFLLSCDKEKSIGACNYLTGLDSLNAVNLSTLPMDSLFHFECVDDVAEAECCDGNAIEGLCPEAHCLRYGTADDIYSPKTPCSSSLQTDSTAIYYTGPPLGWTWAKDESCSDYCQENTCE